MTQDVNQARRKPARAERLPADLQVRFLDFLKERRTGSLILNVKDGWVMALRVEEIVRPRVE